MGRGEAQAGKFREQTAQRPDLRPSSSPSSPGPPVADGADTLPGHSITGSLDTGGAGRAATLPKGANQAGVFAPEVRGDSEWRVRQA